MFANELVLGLWKEKKEEKVMDDSRASSHWVGGISLSFAAVVQWLGGQGSRALLVMMRLRWSEVSPAEITTRQTRCHISVELGRRSGLETCLWVPRLEVIFKGRTRSMESKCRSEHGSWFGAAWMTLEDVERAGPQRLSWRMKVSPCVPLIALGLWGGRPLSMD